MTSSPMHQQHTLDQIEQDIHALSQALETLRPSGNPSTPPHRLAQLRQQLAGLWQEVEAHATEAPKATVHYARLHPWTCAALAVGVLGAVGYFTYQRKRR